MSITAAKVRAPLMRLCAAPVFPGPCNPVPGTKQRFSGLSHIRQCGDDVLRMFVTGGPPVRGGGGMPQRLRTSSRSTPALRMTGAG
jgi:hypothetical protein